MCASSETLQQQMDLFSNSYCELGHAAHTPESFKSRCNVLLRYCKQRDITAFTHDEAASYSTFLEAQVERGEKSLGYARLLRGVAYAFADFVACGSEDYSYLPHNIFVSSINTLNPESRNTLNDYSAYLSETLADSSRYQLLHIISKFLHYMEDNNIKAKDVTPQHVRNFLVFIAASHPNSMDSIIFGVRKFIHFLSDRGYINWSAEMLGVRLPPPRSKVPVAYSDAEIQKLLEAVPTNTPIGKRDYAMIVLALFTGLRSVDIRNLKITDIDWELNTINIVQQKNNRAITIPLLPVVGNAIANYILDGRGFADIPYVFLSHNCRLSGARPIVAGSIGDRIRLYLSKSGVKIGAYDGRGVHTFRRTYATNLLVSGTPLETVASALGDMDVESVKPYLALDDEKLRVCCANMAFLCKREGLYG